MKHKFEALDGLRGIAALGVVLFHQRYWFSDQNFFASGWLAVDFFFMLSGFVLAHAYEERLSAPKAFPIFMRDRLIRLHPMLILGVAIGALFYVRDIVLHVISPGRTFPLTILAGFIPFPAFWSEQAFQLDPATWSLFWELLVNFLYGFIAFRLSNRVLLLIVGASLAFIVIHGLVSNGPYLAGSENDDFLMGLPRVTLTFFLGVILLRVHRRRPFPRPKGTGVIVVLVFTLTLAALPSDTRSIMWYYPLVVVIIYPIILLWAATVVPSSRRAALVIGALSYPIYVLHNPLFHVINAMSRLSHFHWLAAGGDVMAAVRVLVMLTASAAALVFYDQPVRRWLRARFSARVQRA